ncbi:MAG TPA: FAD-dependent oxidoreductase [Candidatus Acidoferrales bacterium]|nr:FAD-dependent oxidoreductase [Candidatus Acidoferrales bacterium]
MKLDVLIFGGGAAGLWCLDAFRRAGYQALLFESNALGAGQTIQAQGIIHGGGKYALRGVRDFAAVRATSAMPERWRRSLAGEAEPALTSTRVLSERCYLWLPRGSCVAAIQSWGFIPLVAKAGLLATPPEKIPKSDWPEALRGAAAAVYSLAEPVVSTGSLLENLAARQRNFIFLYRPATLRIRGTAAIIDETAFEARAIVLTAGAGNRELGQKAGLDGNLMQRRPLKMVLLRGELPALFGHCVVGGKTELTVTTPSSGIWQIGGELAERLAREADHARARRAASGALARWFPGLDLSATEIALYEAVRAEARSENLRRPSGVHASRVAPGIFVGWPTKLSLAPLLAEELLRLVAKDLRAPAGYGDEALPNWPKPGIARYPWEEAPWYPAR